jgi:hypothetical protein
MRSAPSPPVRLPAAPPLKRARSDDELDPEQAWLVRELERAARRIRAGVASADDVARLRLAFTPCVRACANADIVQ